MKNDDSLPVTSTTPLPPKKDVSAVSLFGKGRYKLWAFGAIFLLASWSLFTGTVTLRWSSLNLDHHLFDDLDISLRDDLDVLEMEEREKVVKYMWDVYTNSQRIKLPRFWQQAFEAAYEDMTSDEPGVRDAAISEIAKMSIRSVNIHPPPTHSTGAKELGLKHAEIRKTAMTAGNS